MQSTRQSLRHCQGRRRGIQLIDQKVSHDQRSNYVEAVDLHRWSK